MGEWQQLKEYIQYL